MLLKNYKPPLKIGLISQHLTCPNEQNWPMDSSKKYIGFPIKNKTQRYGIKNAPVEQ